MAKIIIISKCKINLIKIIINKNNIINKKIRKLNINKITLNNQIIIKRIQKDK